RPARLYESQEQSPFTTPRLSYSACRPLPRAASPLGDKAGVEEPQEHSPIISPSRRENRKSEEHNPLPVPIKIVLVEAPSLDEHKIYT
ncbi:hypothetical protein, partial [uncultured Rikenella sp.]|uniref:hypothetical protein n=1 Tax=uncultured Rikenella sp. TaxID=368003 RepID=UPI00262605EB